MTEIDKQRLKELERVAEAAREVYLRYTSEAPWGQQCEGMVEMGKRLKKLSKLTEAPVTK
jgi:hypothetical protein